MIAIAAGIILAFIVLANVETFLKLAGVVICLAALGIITIIIVGMQ